MKDELTIPENMAAKAFLFPHGRLNPAISLNSGS
jgi:hypothetical protein